ASFWKELPRTTPFPHKVCQAPDRCPWHGDNQAKAIRLWPPPPGRRSYVFHDLDPWTLRRTGINVILPGTLESTRNKYASECRSGGANRLPYRLQNWSSTRPNNK